MKHVVYFPLFFLIVLSGCTVKNPASDESVLPVLSGLAVADTLFLNSRTAYPISVKVVDPQGTGDIQRVMCIVFSTRKLSEKTLQDDGKNGDIIPRDGVFFGTLSNSSFGRAPGSYRIGIAAEDAEGHKSDSLFVNVTVVSGEPNERPLLSDPVVPDTVRSDFLQTLFLSVRAGDPQGVKDIASAYFDIYPPLAPNSFFRGLLKDDGTFGDAYPGDGIFSFRGNIRDTLKTIGPHWVRFQAQDKKGMISLPLTRRMVVTGANDPPALSKLSMPDTVSRQSSQPILLSVRASDPQGLSDIKRVYFNTTKPDGTPSAGNPFLMFDDGTNGDKTAGDGVYTLNIYITPQNALGVYRFEFFAEDVSGAVSSSIVHTITVVDVILN